MPKYNLKIKNRFDEEMEVTLCDSFDQAAHILDKEVYRRELIIAKRLIENNQIEIVPKDLLLLFKNNNESNPQKNADKGDRPEVDKRSREERK